MLLRSLNWCMIQTTCLLFAHTQTSLFRTQCQKLPAGYSLIVQATASAGGVAIFGEGVTELAVQLVSQGPRDTFPGHNEDDDDSVGTVVACTMTHQTQQLLCLAPPAYHLTRKK